MINTITHVKPDGQSWVITMTPEMAEAAGVDEGSHVIFFFKEGDVSAEILPPAGEELRGEVRQVVEELGEVFAEMKRRGD